MATKYCFKDILTELFIEKTFPAMSDVEDQLSLRQILVHFHDYLTRLGHSISFLVEIPGALFVSCCFSIAVSFSVSCTWYVRRKAVKAV